MSTGVKAIESLAIEYENCERCPLLVETRGMVVFGSGSASASIVVVGEAPGEEEDEEGVPHIGRAGRLAMDLIIQAWPEDAALMEIIGRYDPDDEDSYDAYYEDVRDYLDNFIFWTNAILCWPGEERSTPGKKELSACRDRLWQTIYAVDPLLILAFGKPATEILLRKTAAIRQVRGSLLDITIPSPVSGDQIRYTMMPLWHTGYLLRQGDQQLAEEKQRGDTWDTIQDLKFAISLLTKQFQDTYETPFPYKE